MSSLDRSVDWDFGLAARCLVSESTERKWNSYGPYDAPVEWMSDARVRRCRAQLIDCIVKFDSVLKAHKMDWPKGTRIVTQGTKYRRKLDVGDGP